MKPLNLDNRPCSPISSNCVIWQGPDITCINLCTGDTVSDVVYNLATELCAVMDTLNITNYDLSCFNLAACPPTDFQALIQLLITQICELQGLTPGTDGTRTTCPDCVVSIATCLRELDPSLPATMQLLDYVQLLANKICTLINTVTDIQTQIDNIDNRVTVLEEAVPPTFTLPTIDTGCFATTLGVSSATIDLVLNALVNDPLISYCQLLASTGTPSEITSAVLSQCILSSTPSLAFPPDTMQEAYANWVDSPITAADAITNLWISLCDMYNGGKVTVVEGGNNINVTSNVVGNTTTYTIDSVGLDYFYAQVTIGGADNANTASATIPNVVNAPGKTVGYGGNNYAIGARVQDVLQYNYMDSNGTVVNNIGGASYVTAPPASTFLSVNNVTGVFRITKKAEYLLTMSMYLKANEDNTAYWKTTGTDGRFDIGICGGGLFPNNAVNSGDIFTGASKSIVANMDSNIILTAQCVVQLPVDFQIIFRMLNLTGEDYAGGDYGGSDSIRVGIVKIRDL